MGISSISFRTIDRFSSDSSNPLMVASMSMVDLDAIQTTEAISIPPFKMILFLYSEIEILSSNLSSM